MPVIWCPSESFRVHPQYLRSTGETAQMGHFPVRWDTLNQAFLISLNRFFKFSFSGININYPAILKRIRLLELRLRKLIFKQ